MGKNDGFTPLPYARLGDKKSGRGKKSSKREGKRKSK